MGQQECHLLSFEAVEMTGQLRRMIAAARLMLANILRSWWRVSTNMGTSLLPQLKSKPL
jgi:hypothetical protein